MDITQIFIFAFVAILLGKLKRGRLLALLAVSAFVIYWLQPVQTPANLTFWFPTFTLLIVVFSWWVAFSSGKQGWKTNLPAMLVLAGVIVLVGMNRYIQLEQVFITDTPRMFWVGLTVAMIISPALPFMRFRENRSGRYIALVFILIGLLVITKLPFALTGIYETMLSLRGKTSPIESTGFLWLGFSYVVFRLVHTIMDRRAGRLNPMPLAEYINYVIFFRPLSPDRLTGSSVLCGT